MDAFAHIVAMNQFSCLATTELEYMHNYKLLAAVCITTKIVNNLIGKLENVHRPSPPAADTHIYVFIAGTEQFKYLNSQINQYLHYLEHTDTQIHTYKNIQQTRNRSNEVLMPCTT